MAFRLKTFKKFRILLHYFFFRGHNADVNINFKRRVPVRFLKFWNSSQQTRETPFSFTISFRFTLQLFSDFTKKLNKARTPAGPAGPRSDKKYCSKILVRVCGIFTKYQSEQFITKISKPFIF